MGKRSDARFREMIEARAAAGEQAEAGELAELREDLAQKDAALRVMCDVFTPRGGEPGPDMHVEIQAHEMAESALTGASDDVLVSRARLREIEWASVQGGIDEVCPACDALRNDRMPGGKARGHDPGCWLADAIGGESDEVEVIVDTDEGGQTDD